MVTGKTAIVFSLILFIVMKINLLHAVSERFSMFFITIGFTFSCIQLMLLLI